MPEVKWTPFPDNQRNPLNPSQADYEEQIRRTKAALSVGLIRENNFDLIVLANGYQYEKEFNLGPARKTSDGKAKTWWGNYSFEAAMLARNADGSFATVPNTDSEPGLQWTCRELQEFYKLYHSHFPVIPKFITWMFSAEDAGRVQFGDGPALDFPVGKVLRNDPTQTLKTTFPRDIVFRVTGGVAEWCKRSEYESVYPYRQSGGVPPLTSNAAERVGAAASIIFSPGTNDEKDSKLAQLYR